MLCRADPDACIGVDNTTLRTATEHLRSTAWSCEKQRRNSDCGSQSAAARNFHRWINHGGRCELFSRFFAGRNVKLTIVADGTTATYAQTIALTSDSPDVAESLTGQFHRRFSEQFDLIIQGKGLNELKKYRLERISWRIAAAELPEEAFFGHHLSCIKDPARNGMTIYTSHAV